MVTIGGMSKKPILVPTGAMIFKDLTLRGFWMTRWIEKASLNDRTAMLNDIINLIKSKKLQLWTETVPLDSYKESIQRSLSSHKDSKLVFKF